MSNIKISELGQAGALTGDELIPIVQDNETLRTTANQLKAFAGIAISNDIIGDAASTTLAPSVNAIKTYTDGLVSGLLNDRGNYTPDMTSPGAYPTSANNGSGVGGAVQKGDIWFINGNGFLGMTSVVVGVSVRALVNNPSPTTDSDWDILDASLIQPNLQSVLTSNNTANLTLVLTNNPYTSTLASSYISFYNTSGANSVYNASIFTLADSSGNYINGTTGGFKVYNSFSTNYTELKFNSVKYNNSSFIGSLETSTLTSSQTWTLPNASGTIALTNNIWNATGNAGTVAGANFLGTTDAVDLVLKTNNLERIRVANTGGVIISNLAGTGTRTVVVTPTGQLSTTISSSGWSTLGNASTSPLTNFIGTTDDVDLVFKTNNVEQLRLKSTGGSGNIETPFDIYAQNNMGGSTIIAKDSAAINGFASISWDTTNKGILSLGNGTVKGTIKVSNLTSTDKTYQLPNASGTLALNENTWGLTGNAGTTAGTNFIGTTDNVDVVFKRNNVERLRINTNGNVIATDSFRAVGVDTSVQAYSNSGNGGVMIAQDSVTKGYVFMSNGTGDSQIQCTNLTASGRILELPNASGTIALTTDVTLQNVLAGTNKNLTNGINFQGTGAGTGNTGTSNINAFGTDAAMNNSGNIVVAIGDFSGQDNSGTAVVAIGTCGVNNSGSYVVGVGYACTSSNSGNYVIGIGSGAAINNSGSNVNAFGHNAGDSNQISGATIFSNASLPSYANYAAASAAITTGAGGTAGCTYLYHDQATNSIGAVRL